MSSPRSSWVLTILGPDRRGVVERLSRTIAENGGNWEESRMARLAGRFAGILRISAPSDKSEQLLASVRALATEGVEISVEHALVDPFRDYQVLRLSLTGSDREGIVRDVVQALAERGVNVEEFETDRKDAPWSGGMLFEMQAQLKSPPEVRVDELRQDLEKIADDLAVEIALDEQAPKSAS